MRSTNLVITAAAAASVNKGCAEEIWGGAPASQFLSRVRMRYCYGKSVRLSVTLWYCIKTSALIVKLSTFW